MALNLHLGCGDRMIRLPDWVNVDVRPDLRPDVVDDIRNPSQWACGSVDLIYACHVLEHFKRNELVPVLKRWKALLKPDGILRVSVPSLGAAMVRYREEINAMELQNLLVGAQRHPQDYHYWVFDELLLVAKFQEAGFPYGNISHWKWQETDHAVACDDHASAYLPHMDKKNGRLMSLNLQVRNG